MSAADLQRHKVGEENISVGDIELDIPGEAVDFLGRSPEDMSLDEGLGAILENATASLGGILRSAAVPAVTALTAALFCGMAETAFESSNRVMKVIPLAGALAIVAAAGSDIARLASEGYGAVRTLRDFSKGLLASLAAAGGIMGSPGGASARYVAAMLFSDALMTFIDRVMMPALYAYIAVVTAEAAIGGDTLSGLAKLLKNTVTTVLALILTAFTLYLSVSGLVAGGTDALTVKAAKTVISNAVPVVGGVLSDAGETVVASTRLVRNTAGIAGIITLISLVIPPFLHLGARYLLLKLAAAVSPLVSEGRLSKLIENLSGAFGILLGMLGACSLMWLISVVSMINLGSA